MSTTGKNVCPAPHAGQRYKDYLSALMAEKQLTLKRFEELKKRGTHIDAQIRRDKVFRFSNAIIGGKYSGLRE